MALEQLITKAIARVNEDNPDNTGGFRTKVYERLMDGTLVTVTFQTNSGKEDSNHVHFGRDDIRVYRWHSDVLNAVANYKERLWFFRFMEMAGIGGVIAFMLILIFSILLCVLAFSSTQNNPQSTSIVEVVKSSFTLILGYFFGQAAKK